MGDTSETHYQRLDELYRKESRRVYATLIRLLGDFDLAEDAMHDAFKAALEQWDENGIPAHPVSWLISTGRFKAIDRLRRQSRFDQLRDDKIRNIEAESADLSDRIDKEIEDDILRLVFTCCHPVLTEELRVALTLREVCGLTTEEIARAYLVKTSALAQRIVRAKSRIRRDRKSTRLNSSHVASSYSVFCLKKKKKD